MEINKIDDNLFTARTFISGSEANLLAYEFTRKEDSGPLSLSENFSSSAPVNIIASVAKNKISKLFGPIIKTENKDIVINGFDAVYDIQKDSIEFSPSDYIALIPLARSIQISFPAHDFLMIEPQEIVLISSQLAPTVAPDASEENNPAIIASISLI